MKTFLPALLILVIALSASVSWAAKVAKVDVDNAELREGPEKKSNVIMTLPKGIWVATSNMPVRGFYKIRTGKGVVGWVATTDIVVSEKSR